MVSTSLKCTCLTETFASFGFTFLGILLPEIVFCHQPIPIRLQRLVISGLRKIYMGKKYLFRSLNYEYIWLRNRLHHIFLYICESNPPLSVIVDRCIFLSIQQNIWYAYSIHPMFNLSVKAFRTVVYINERNIAFKTLYIYAYLNKFKSALALPEICTDCVYP